MEALPRDVSIIEQSWMARCACLFMKTDSVAMVWGRKILLWGVSRQEFLANRSWVQHELQHVRQFRELGTGRFVVLYLAEWVKKGYHNNRFEREARAAENRSEHYC